jgi:hypothetical protein
LNWLAIPIVEASRQKKSPPDLRTRHVPRSIRSKCASSRAKCSTVLLITASAHASSNDMSSTSSTRKFDIGRAGANSRATARTLSTACGVRVRRTLHTLPVGNTRGFGRPRIRRPGFAFPAKYGLSEVARKDRCRSGQIAPGGWEWAFLEPYPPGVAVSNSTCDSPNLKSPFSSCPATPSRIMF